MIDSFKFEPNPNDVDVRLPPDEQGYPEALAVQDRDPGVLFQAGGEASLTSLPDGWYVEDNEVEDLCAENDTRHTWGFNRRSRFTNQHPTHECTNHSEVDDFEIARNADLGIIYHDGPKVDFTYEESKTSGDVFFSCMWPYLLANPNIRGGAMIRDILKYTMQYGHLPDRIQPYDYKFKHTLTGTMGQGNSNQSSGPWVKFKDLPPGWQETAKWFKPKEIVYPDDWRVGRSIVLRGRGVSVGRNGHAVTYSGYSFRTRMMRYTDHYNVVRWDSERLWKSCIASGSYSIISTTHTADRLKPAG
jgi:hypothetical protein